MSTNLPGNFNELITNSYFIDWVRNPTPESERYWQEFLHNNPSIEKEFNKAQYVIKTLQRGNKVIDEENVREIWNSIYLKLESESVRFRLLETWKVAAAIVFIVGLASLFYFQFNKSDVDYKSIAIADAEVDNVTLVLSDGQQKVFHSKQPSFSYLQEGAVVIDSTETLPTLDDPREIKHGFNQLVIPYGKRSKLYLSDGSEVILNSGSHVIYPVQFNGDKREIYIVGEAYLKVAHNPDLPFYVKTDQMAVRVLGTEFNVSAYADENDISVVLVSGSVEAQLGKEELLLTKNEKLTFHKASNQIEQDVVNVREYVSWKDGWMYFDNETIGRIATILSRYYNLDISFQDKKAGMLTMTGKIDLRSDYREVLDIICFSAPVQYFEKNERVIFMSK